MDHTGWHALYPGTLNLGVDRRVVPDLAQCPPIWIEDGASVVYPKGFERIPKLRRAYHYYLGDAQHGDLAQQVLVRIAANPITGRVEILAPVSLRNFFGVSDGDSLTIAVGELKNALH